MRAEKQGRSVWRRRLMIPTVGALALALVLGVGFLVALAVSEPVSIHSRAGVTTQHGDVVLVTCQRIGIGSVSLQRGDEADGHVVWKVTHAGHHVVAELPVRAANAGFDADRSELPLEPGSTYAVQEVESDNGSPLISSYIVFVPSQLRSGVVETVYGDMPLQRWKTSC
jgi:hypothetical protein